MFSYYDQYVISALHMMFYWENVFFLLGKYNDIWHQLGTILYTMHVTIKQILLFRNSWKVIISSEEYVSKIKSAKTLMFKWWLLVFYICMSDSS